MLNKKQTIIRCQFLRSHKVGENETAELSSVGTAYTNTVLVAKKSVFCLPWELEITIEFQ